MQPLGLADTNFHVSHSLSGQRWRQREADMRSVLTLMQQQELPELVARLLVARGVQPEQAADYLQPTLRQLLPDPSQLKDMKPAAERLASALMQGEKIAVFGDYDVDGATASALLANYFHALGQEVEIYIPDRILEGYGPNEAALRQLKDNGASVIVTVDCGSVAYGPISAIAQEGVDVIVVDHHLADAELPEAFAVINPNRLDEDRSLGQLCAAGVCFMLLVGLTRQLRETGYFTPNRAEPNLLDMLDLVALGTVCDVVPLTGINRAFVAQGLKVLAQRKQPGLRALADVAGLREAPEAYHLGFLLGPRINAGGRVGEASLGAQLLTCRDDAKAEAMAQKLHRYNAERQAIEAQMLEEAIAMAEAKSTEPSVLILAKEGWHPGVIGIVAGRLKERFGLPTAVIALEGGTGKASARSISGVDLGTAIARAKQEGLLIAGGGHAMAAGFTVEEAKITALQSYLDAALHEHIAQAQSEAALQYDGWVHLAGLTLELAEMLEAAGPYGAGNPGPVVAVPQVQIVRAELLGGNHLRLILADATSKARITAMAFRMGDTPMGQQLLAASLQSRWHVAGKLKRNEWNGRVSAQLIVEDVAEA